MDTIPALKEQLRQSILAEVGERNQLTLALALGIDKPRMSNLQHGHLERFSLEKLIRLLANINRRVDLTVVRVGPIPWPRCGNRGLQHR
ncbi:MAG: XRE family transcriptional regulator [Gemmatimonadaceae bacterium]